MLEHRIPTGPETRPASPSAASLASTAVSRRPVRGGLPGRPCERRVAKPRGIANMRCRNFRRACRRPAPTSQPRPDTFPRATAWSARCGISSTTRTRRSRRPDTPALGSAPGRTTRKRVARARAKPAADRRPSADRASRRARSRTIMLGQARPDCRWPGIEPASLGGRPEPGEPIAVAGAGRLVAIAARPREWIQGKPPGIVACRDGPSRCQGASGDGWPRARTSGDTRPENTSSGPGGSARPVARVRPLPRRGATAAAIEMPARMPPETGREEPPC